MKSMFVSSVLTAGLIVASDAAASEHELYYAQAGALLNYAEAEVRILYAAVTQRVFDPTITRQSVDELERTLTAAKRQVGRAGTLLPDKLASQQAGVDRLRQQIIAAERQLERFDEIVTAAIEELTRDEEEDYEEELEEGEGPPETDWAGIRASCAWLANDIKTARTSYGSIAKRIAAKPLRFPPPPRGQRPE